MADAWIERGSLHIQDADHRVAAPVEQIRSLVFPDYAQACGDLEQLRHDHNNLKVIAEDWEKQSEDWETRAREALTHAGVLEAALSALEHGGRYVRGPVEKARAWLSGSRS